MQLVPASPDHLGTASGPSSQSTRRSTGRSQSFRTPRADVTVFVAFHHSMVFTSIVYKTYSPAFSAPS